MQGTRGLAGARMLVIGGKSLRLQMVLGSSVSTLTASVVNWASLSLEENSLDLQLEGAGQKSQR